MLPPVAAVPIVLALQTAAGLGDLRTVRRDCHRPSLLALAAGATTATPAGAFLLGAASATSGRLGIALLVLVAALLLSGGVRLQRVPGAGLSLGVGLSGLANGFAAMLGPPVIAAAGLGVTGAK